MWFSCVVVSEPALLHQLAAVGWRAPCPYLHAGNAPKNLVASCRSCSADRRQSSSPYRSGRRRRSRSSTCCSCRYRRNSRTYRCMWTQAECTRTSHRCRYPSSNPTAKSTTRSSQGSTSAMDCTDLDTAIGRSTRYSSCTPRPEAGSMSPRCSNTRVRSSHLPWTCSCRRRDDTARTSWSTDHRIGPSSTPH